MTKALFISRALVSRYADAVELDEAMRGAQRKFKKQLGESVGGAIERFKKVVNMDTTTERAASEVEQLVAHEIDKRKVERSRIAKARAKMREEATKDALEDALYA